MVKETTAAFNKPEVLEATVSEVELETQLNLSYTLANTLAW